jgi:hypothetical protein
LLDGDVQEDLREESICLLRRARWLPDTAKSVEWDAEFAQAAARAGMAGRMSLATSSNALRSLNPRCFSKMASSDVASNICWQMLLATSSTHSEV